MELKVKAQPAQRFSQGGRYLGWSNSLRGTTILQKVGELYSIRALLSFTTLERCWLLDKGENGMAGKNAIRGWGGSTRL